jgi:hypothetical protein
MQFNLPIKTVALFFGLATCLPATADIFESTSAKLGMQLQRLGVDVELANICQIPKAKQLALDDAYREMFSAFLIIEQDKSLTASQKSEFGSSEDARKRFVAGEQSAAKLNQGSTGPTCIAFRRDWNKIEAGWAKYADGVKTLRNRYDASNK